MKPEEAGPIQGRGSRLCVPPGGPATAELGEPGPLSSADAHQGNNIHRNSNDAAGTQPLLKLCRALKERLEATP